MRKLTTEIFIIKARKKHGDKYDYSKAIYLGNKIKVIIICPIHGEFKQTPSDHLAGYSCPGCKADKIGNLKRLTIDQYIEKANKIHNNKFGYDNFIYKGSTEKSIFTCHEHGDFEQEANSHLQGIGCPKCCNEGKRLRFLLTQEEVIKRFIEVHDDLYGYNNVDYKGIDTCVIIDCKVNDHGEFEQTPYLHLIGHGCPKCKSSKGELALIKIFKKHNINFKHQFKFDKYKKLRYDFYLKDLNLLVEFHGGQHYKPIKWFGGIEGFKSSIKRDAFKKSLAWDNKIPIIYFTYKHLRMPKEQFEQFVLSVINKVLIKKIIL